ncbi:MAG: bifunctional 23S rRNA (guanine(2069)-N(7))-methyltransferase RlmK/23S rRNA (guanine(2445)-N(2))-methyltransferase RlmL [Myxococcales bacterium]|nr:bifunctional 23S rRNA (guanine(2069)-N(7))-methyltransferase RlmK/23S rRNA (guanine(2445)-N(2))-methyltransferase RlmL [Myxococcales bacterium]
MQLRITCAAGTEGPLDDELRALGLASPEDRGGAGQRALSLDDGPAIEALYRVATWSRVASRVVVVLGEDQGVEEPDALYEAVAALPWEDHFARDTTFAVDLAARGTKRAHHGRFLTQRAKDAVVDRLRARRGSRPSVDRDAPDLRVHVRWSDAGLLVGVDAFGPLHLRGYRPHGAPAPLRENLAAALLALAGWDGEAPLVDPMCGSGTLLVEAAWIARDVAPGRWRRLGAWPGHVAHAFEALQREAEARARAAADRPVRILGCDVDIDALALARESLERAGVRGVTVRRQDVRDLAPPSGWPPGHLVINPPYGERLGADGHEVGDDAALMQLHAQLGDVFKRRFGGWTAHLLTGNARALGHVGLRPARKHVVFNGPIECRFATYPLRAPKGEEGPRWRKASAESDAFANRVRKNLKRIAKRFAAQGVDAYRVYDADIPEYNVALDRYATDAGVHVVVQEYQRPRRIDEGTAERHLRDVLLRTPELFGIEEDAVHVRTRARHRGSQYERRTSEGARYEVREGELVFFVDFERYLDTGLFLDHRLVRAELARRAAQTPGARFLNLFAYTGSASAYAAAAGASTTSVDLSQTYLQWAEDVLRRNELEGDHRFVRADAMRFLARAREARDEARNRWDLVFLNPPSYSRSKAMDDDFSVTRDHAPLLDAAMAVLAPGGELYFTTHARGFALDPALRQRFAVEDVGARLVPDDFARSPFHAFVLRHR